MVRESPSASLKHGLHEGRRGEWHVAGKYWPTPCMEVLNARSESELSAQSDNNMEGKLNSINIPTVPDQPVLSYYRNQVPKRLSPSMQYCIYVDSFLEPSKLSLLFLFGTLFEKLFLNSPSLSLIVPVQYFYSTLYVPHGLWCGLVIMADEDLVWSEF